MARGTVGRGLVFSLLAALAAGGCGATGGAPGCGTDDQCGPTEYCQGAECVPGCTSPHDCPSGVCGAHGRCGVLLQDAAPAPPDATPGPPDAAPPEDAAVQDDAAPQRDAPQADAAPCPTPASRCNAGSWQTCADGVWGSGTACATLCDVTLGCIECVPGQDFCVGDLLHACTVDGHQGTLIKNCGVGACKVNACLDPCAAAAGNQTYIGCDYWATVTTNSQLDPGFTYALGVANTGTQAANVTVSGGGLSAPLAQSVAAGTLATLTLPWVDELKQTFMAESSLLATNKAYHLTSDQPVVVYQFDALEYQSAASAYSYTNDASLVLPSHVLKPSYLAMSRAPLVIRRTDYDDYLFWSECGSDTYLTSPGFLSVVATQAGTTQVSVAFAGHARAVSGISTNYGKGQTGQFTLNQGDVLQLVSATPSSCPGDHCDGDCEDFEYRDCYCDASADYDLTGSEITASQNVAVFSGHNCAFVPYYRWACDHLEEQLFPTSTWGKHYVAAKTTEPNNNPNVYRVLSAVDGNTITLTPAVAGPFALAKGKYAEFTTSQAFEATGTGAFLLAQFMVGQDYAGVLSGNPGGDPSMALAVPVEQYRGDYIFLAPATYQQNYVTIIAPAAATVTLDGTAVTGWTTVGSGAFRYATVPVAAGNHRATSITPFGIASYGVAPYTSYMYPGGLNLVSQ